MKSIVLKILFIPILIRRLLLNSITRHHIISYPKSGRTWARFFLAEYFTELYGIKRRFNFRTFFKAHKEIPRFDFNHGNFHGQTLTPLNNYIKSLSGHKVLLLVRDPRDVVVSLHHHSQHRQNMLDSKGMDLDAFIKHDQLGISRIVEYFNTWYRHRDVFDDFKIVSYEELKCKNTVTPLEVFPQFLEQQIDAKAIVIATQNSDFKNMKQHERSGESDSQILRTPDVENENSYKVRKGKVGSHREEMSDESIKYCERELKKLNLVFGY